MKTKTYKIGENKVMKLNKKKETIKILDKKTLKEAVSHLIVGHRFVSA